MDIIDYMTEEKQKSKKIEEIKEQLEQCEKQKAEYLAGWQRARADFINYKKEETERISSSIFYVYINIISKIMPILDDFERAEKEASKVLKDCQDSEIKKSFEGLLQTKKQIQDFLKSQKIEPIKAIGEKFDPNFHEAVEEVEEKDKETGIIIEEIQKGYTLEDKVIRPAKVKVVK